MKQEEPEIKAEANSKFGHTRHRLKLITQDQTGVTAIEYALLAGLIVVVAAGSIAALSDAVNELWMQVSYAVSDAL